jgi:uncharacterized protein (TIGR03437 family)
VIKFVRTSVLLLLIGHGVAHAQNLTNSSLNGKYFFVQLLISVDASSGLPTNVSNLGGSITFNGGGLYTYSGSLGTNAAAAGSVSGGASYSVSADGSVVFTNPIHTDLTVTGRLSADGEVILGSTTENTGGNTGDLFVAVKAPSAAVSNAALNGTYYGSTMALPNGTIQSLSSSFVYLVANGTGQFTSAAVNGHEADQFDKNGIQTLSNTSYAMNADGTGTANFGSAVSSTLLNGTKSIFLSADGNYILGYSTASGARDIFLATKSFSSSASNTSFKGRYWIAELDYDNSQHNLSSASGAFVANGSQSILLSERLNGGFNFSSVYYDLINPNSLGQFTRSPESGLVNMALGAPSNSGTTTIPNAMVGAQIDLSGLETTYYGVFFATLAPTFNSSSPGTVFLNPNGVVNAATFAPAPNAIAPGDIVTLFGSGLSPATDQPGTIPLPISDKGVSVTVNGIAAPLFYISAGQINIQIPFEVAGGSTVTIQVANNGQKSNSVIVPLAPSNPGIFMWADSAEPYHAAVLHTNGALVNSSDPARPGETIEVFATGLGLLSPAVRTGATNPDSPPATATDQLVNILFDGEPATKVPFAGGAPAFVGLNQINVVIPADATTGDPVSIQIETSWGYSNLANIPIQ